MILSDKNIQVFLRELFLDLMLVIVIITASYFVASCSEPNQISDFKYEYSILNSSKIDLGIKIIPASASNNFEIKDTSFKLKAGSEQTFILSATKQDISAMVNVIEVHDVEFKVRFKIADFSQITTSGLKTTVTISMPNPVCKPIAVNNTEIKLYIDEKSIFGFFPKPDQSGSNFFSTPDLFETLSVNSISSSRGPFVMIERFDDTFLFQDNNAYATVSQLLKSENSGSTWYSYMNIYSNADEDFLGSHFINATQGWCFVYSHHDSTLIYKIDQGVSTKISAIKDYCVIDVKFLDANRGYLVANSSNNVSPSDNQDSYLFKTIDGGITWSEPIKISSTEKPQKLFAYEGGKLILMRGQTFSMHKGFYHSDNDGLNWKVIELPINDFIRDLHFINAQVGYIKTGNNAIWSSKNSGFVYKTSDGGMTWNRITSQNILGSRIYFHDEKIGLLQDIIYGEGQVLMVTRDGGLTWKEIIYPYSYLIK